MQRWGFHDAELVDGPAKEQINLEEMISTGLVLPEYMDVLWQEVQYHPQGKVACHLGHLEILKIFLKQKLKSYALIFEDDLEEGPEMSLQDDLKDFFSLVPQDFDLLHLGFVRESRSARCEVPGTQGRVFRSAEALGRHAYLLTRKTAELLLQETLPMYNHGDKMFQDPKGLQKDASKKLLYKRVLPNCCVYIIVNYFSPTYIQNSAKQKKTKKNTQQPPGGLSSFSLVGLPT